MGGTVFLWVFCVCVCVCVFLFNQPQDVLLVSKQIFFFSAACKLLVCEMTFYIFYEVKQEYTLVEIP